MSPATIPDAALSNEFILPTTDGIPAKLRPDGDKHINYLCGNSLGPASKHSIKLVQEELQVWSTNVVTAHMSHPLGRPWVKYTDEVNALSAEIIGAKPKEVSCMGTLTSNLHLLMDSLYKPTTERYKILCEARAFPSDQYAFASQAKAHGLDPAATVLELSPRKGEYTIREEDILEVIAKEGKSIAVVIFAGVQYYTGQCFPMKTITKKAKEQGCICGWDLAHAAGNVQLSLHDWDVDFAVWCTYKYLNSGPGGIGGLFLHEKWEHLQPAKPGWWGNELETRFKMLPQFSPIVGAQGFQQSNPSVLALASLLGALRVFKEVGMMGRVRERSVQLTNVLEAGLQRSKYFVPLNEVRQLYPQPGSGERGFTIITPSNASERGAQLSLLFLPAGSGVSSKVFAGLSAHGVIGDERNPDVIRLAPAPLYNTVKDCEEAAQLVDELLKSLE